MHVDIDKNVKLYRTRIDNYHLTVYENNLLKKISYIQLIFDKSPELLINELFLNETPKQPSPSTDLPCEFP